MLISLNLLFATLSVHAFALREYDQSPKNYFHLSNVINKYSKDDLVNLLREFVKETRPTRVVGSSGHFKAQEFIIDYIKKKTSESTSVLRIDEFVPNIDSAIKMYEDDLKSVTAPGVKIDKKELQKWTSFTQSRVAHLEKLRQTKGRNIIWEKKGSTSPNEVIVIGAHYDTMAYNKKTLEILPLANQPGADNNASGVAIGLSLIELLSELKIAKTVRVVFFDFQELGFLGSLDYATKLKEEINSGLKFESFINLLMLGHDSKLNDKEKQYGNMRVYYSLKDNYTFNQEESFLNDFLKPSKTQNVGTQFQMISNDFKNGDSVSFHNLNLPSVTFSQNWEDDFNGQRIHTSNDFVETLNFKTYFENFRSIAFNSSAWALGLRK